MMHRQKNIKFHYLIGPYD